ncbi:MAG: hypothetical protein RSA19_02680 [Cetobacterium sp.]
MENKYKIIAIVGKSGAGKDAILNALCDRYKGLNKIISTTTRPIREGEVEGVNYHYVTGDEFGEKVVNFEMIEACDFRDWFYGTELKALDPKRINVGVFNVAGVEALREDTRVILEVIYIVCPNKTRLIRSLSREDNPNIEEIFRRYEQDAKDFRLMDFQFTALMNTEKSDLNEVVEKAKVIIMDKMKKYF